MARFNKQTAIARVANEAGGLGFEKDPRTELALLALTSFGKDQFYRSADATFKRAQELALKLPTEYVAKAAVYARRVGHMRTTSHFLAAQVALMSKREGWLRNFFRLVVQRPDDILEIIAAFQSYRVPGQKVRKLPKSFQKGLADALSGFSAYQLAKYRAAKQDISLIDAVRLLHPKPTDRNREAFEQLVKGSLTATETWETKLTQAGQKAAAFAVERGITKEGALALLKSGTWTEMLTEDQLGYMALLRNLRNIAMQSPASLPLALEKLRDPERIRRSKVLPFRFQTAADEFKNSHEVQPEHTGEILAALSDAANVALENMPELPGRTLVALDASGSMEGKPWNIGRLFAAALAQRNRADILIWGDHAEGYRLTKAVDLLIAAELLNSKFQNGGTSYSLIYNWIEECAKKGMFYDRVIVLTDSQSWIGDSEIARQSMVKGHVFAGGGEVIRPPKWWTFDLQGYSTLQVRQENSYVVGGFSEAVLGTMARVEGDRQALVKEIEAVNLMEGVTSGDEIPA